jgi:membrane-associated HD superfamily phosphohydrolase
VPQYLQKVKNDIEEEYNTLKQLKQEQIDEEDRQKFLMSAEEIDALKDGLKKKWETVNKEYQTITHIRKPDTQGLKRKKENCEKELAQIEKDLALLEKPFVFVDTTY